MKDSKPVVSIIIPCYNHGKYLEEAITSVENYSAKDVYEIIIVDDGSSDPETLALFKKLEEEGYTIIHQTNRGLGAARNTGIAAAKGEFILPLDSDNKIRPAYIDKGIEIMSQNEDIGVVYGNHLYFGNVDHKQPRVITNFNLKKLMEDNYIDACAIYRKKVWEDVNGYDENMPYMGFEDWDFWIRVGLSGWKFHYVNEVLFDYRVRKDSMIMSFRQKGEKKKVYQHVFSKLTNPTSKIYGELIYDLYLRNREIKYFNQKPFLYFLKKWLSASNSKIEEFYNVPLKNIIISVFKRK